ncbi:hypothetical protein N7G274_002008 [Stereocaulon virgatum]|uniref:DUF6594 domain-containing protein n=1 Tax=Stereocaulon virgatum TaxID=373712 RepID=A0ABR4AJF4_9LECA
MLEALAWDKKMIMTCSQFPGLTGKNDKDALSRLFLGPLVEAFHNVIGRFYKKGSTKDTHVPEPMIHYSDSNILRVADIFTTIISAGLPVASIIALNSIHRTIIRLVVVAVFTITLSLFLSLFTSSRRIENFAARAGSAAVQVVFVGATTSARNTGG